MDHTVITIARSYGSGGRTLGKYLAKALGIPCYDYEIIKLASEDSGIHEKLFGAVDERKKVLPVFGISQNIYKGEVLPPESEDFTSEDNLFNLQAKTIKDLAAKGSCVIIGRCADFILKDMEGINLVKLYFYAPRQCCIDRVQYQNGGTEQDIIRKIDQIDNFRSGYYKYHTGRDWNDATNYDLCINTTSTSYDQLVEFVKSYVEIKGHSL